MSYQPYLITMETLDDAESLDEHNGTASGQHRPAISGAQAAEDLLNECFNDPKRQRQLQRWARFLLAKDTSETGIYGSQVSLVSSITSILSATFAQSARVPEMVKNLRETVAKEDLVAHDVYPDGNCLFAAIVDQLRVRADFSWSASTLRQEAVEYLRCNPTQPSGTHLQDFLIDETWDHYLIRMVEDGEWGDHIIIGAVVEVIQMPIVILGSISGQGRTVVKPRRLLKDTMEEEFQKTDHTKSTHSVSPDKDSSKRHEDEDVVKEDCLFLGHFAESHYVSLRRSNWKTKLQERMVEISNKSGPNVAENHLNFMLRYIRNSDLILRQGKESQQPKLLDDMCSTHDGYTTQYVGQITEGLQCYIKPFTSSMPTTEILFQNEVHEQKDRDLYLYQFKTPYDSIVLQCDRGRKESKDLIASDSFCRPGYLRLFPLNVELWSEALATNKGEEGAIRHLAVKDFERPEDAILTLLRNESSGKCYAYSEPYIFFRCQWPGIAAEWLIRPRPSGWPSAEIVREIENYGCTVEPDDSSESEYPNTEWKYNFSIAEKLLARKYITKSQRYCFWLMSLLIQRFGRQGLTHKHLRTVFFYTCESIPDADWCRSPGTCLINMLNKLQKYLQEKRLPHYFMRTVNTLKKFSENALATMESTIEVLIHNLPIAVYFLLDEHNHMLSNLCLMMDAIFDDVHRRMQGNCQQDPLFRVFIPESIQLIQSCLLMDDVTTAGRVFTEEILESKITVGVRSQVQLTRLFGEAVAWADIIHAWCFAFSLVEEYGTPFIKVVNKNQSTVPLATIFGEEFVQYLNCTEVTVPQVCVEEQSFSVLEFVCKAAKLLVELYKYDVVILGLRYFLEKSGYIDKDTIEKVEQLLDNSNRGRKDPKSNCSMAFYDLQGIYSALCTACKNTDRLVCFRDHMDIFERLCLQYKSPTSMKMVAQLWRDFGCHDKADAVTKQVKENVRTIGIIFL